LSAALFISCFITYISKKLYGFTFITFSSVVLDCGAPDTPSNGGVSYTLTTEDSTVVYSCDDGFVLCGDENRSCLSTGVWSGSVPDCISEYIVTK